MRILLSAYACEPNKGSEPGVGWNWAVELARHHEVWVLTRENNRTTIEDYFVACPQYVNSNLHFVYVNVSKELTFWKKGNRGIRLYYLLWQKKAYKYACKLSEKVKFDFVQHVTFVSYTQPCYMYKLGIPFIWGPISGGENIPTNVRIQKTIKENLAETIRIISQHLALITPSVRKNLKHAKVIFAATEETKMRIPQRYWPKTIVFPAISLEKPTQISCSYKKKDKIKIVMAGRLIYWKAFDLGIRAFLKIADRNPNAELHILGEGNKKKELLDLCKKYLNKQIFFVKPVQHDEIYNFYARFDLFLNTTLRDSGCMTMMEAMSVGLPCIAIATGGPALLLHGIPECLVSPQTNEIVIDHLAEKIDKLLNDDDLRYKMGVATQKEVQKFFSLNKYSKFIEMYLKYVD